MIQTAIYILLCILQPICLPIPETATVLWGSVKLGAFPSFILGVAGSSLGIMIMYRMASYGTSRLTAKLKTSEKLEQYRSYVQRQEILITGLLFIIPVLPDEIICVGAAVIGITFSRFAWIAVLSKCCSVAMIAFSKQLAEYCHIGRMEVICFEILFLFFCAFMMKLRQKNGGSKDESEGNYRTI